MDDVDLNELWSAYRPYLFAHCYKFLRDKAAAEDATQETFLRVRRSFDRVPCNPDEARAWIHRVATNYCLNEIRNRGRRPQPIAELSGPERGTEVGPNRFDRVEERLANRQLARRLIDRASTNLSRVAWLYHVDGMGQQEIADALGISRRTVVARLAKFAGSSRQLCGRWEDA